MYNKLVWDPLKGSTFKSNTIVFTINIMNLKTFQRTPTFFLSVWHWLFRANKILTREEKNIRNEKKMSYNVPTHPKALDAGLSLF
jgi:hypothetical protein